MKIGDYSIGGGFCSIDKALETFVSTVTCLLADVSAARWAHEMFCAVDESDEFWKR